MPSHLLSLCPLPHLGCPPSVHCVFNPSRLSSFIVSFSWVSPDFLFFGLFQLSWVRIITYAISLIVKLIGLVPLHLDLIRKGILSKANCLGLNLSAYERIYVKIYRSTSL